MSPLAATAEHNGGLRDKFTAEQSDKDTKYSFMAGYSYTRLNQVNNSRYGLQGVKLAAGRDYKKYYALVAEGGYYRVPTGSAHGGNPGDPSVFELFAAPEVHALVFGRWSGFLHGLVGVEHTGGESMNPATSFAGGYGGGLEYKWKNHMAFRAWGDETMASFSLRNATPENAYSAHRTRNLQATFGLIYRF